MSKLAIIGGTGMTDFEGLEITKRQTLQTPYGETSSPVIHGTYCGKSIVFLARHGSQQNIPPHKVNYRANMKSLKELGVTNVIAIASVGGIHPDMQPKDLVIPHQIIDYTWSREQTFFAEDLEHVTHIDFTEPYCENLRDKLLTAAQGVDFQVHSQGVYGATQGPRLETAAEIDRMDRDGCDIVGMTGMPEAALARELGLCYATCAIVANQAAGRSPTPISLAEIKANMSESIQHVYQLLAEVIRLL
jgi:5'-methylthioinosine phosphorylase